MYINNILTSADVHASELFNIKRYHVVIVVAGSTGLTSERRGFTIVFAVCYIHIPTFTR